VAPYCNAPAGLFGQRLLARLFQALDVEHGAVRETAGEADDAGLAQQLEQLADGGGFDVVEAGGELHDGQSHFLGAIVAKAACMNAA
jgi:hypothetical protein